MFFKSDQLLPLSPKKRSQFALLKVFGLLLMLFVSEVHAACSPYYGLATLNEAGKVGFVETKLLWSSIPASEYNTWTIRICTTSSCTTIPVNGSTLYNNVYLVTSASGLIPNNAVFDIRLRDGSGNTIDYLTVGNYTPQYDSSCPPYYDWTASVSNSHDYRRMPDGTGNWGNAGSGNSGGNSEGDTNDPDAPLISVVDITLTKGNTATFTATIPSAESFNVSFKYFTVDGDANSVDHYTYTAGTATILAGSTSTTMSVATTPNSPGGTVVFYLLLYESVNGSIVNHFPAANLLNAPSLHHIEITHDGAGVTCETEPITIKACANLSCSTVATTNANVTLSATGAPSTWSSNPVSIPANSAAGVTVTLAHTTAETVTLSATSSPAASNALVCKNGASSSCDIVFSNTGFKFYGNGTVDNVANQIAGKASNIAPGNQAISIRAIQTNPATGRCDALINNASENIGFAYQCNSPGTCGITNNGMAIKGSATIDAVTSGYTNVSVDFDASGTGILDLNYFDVGQISLYATANLAVDAQSVTVQGNSNPFIVRPFSYDIQVTGNPNATSSTDPVFAIAGNNFPTTLRSILWEAADDLDNNGIADVGANLAGNGITPNIANIPTTGNDISLTPAAQIVAYNGNLGVNNLNFNQFIATGLAGEGTALISQSWDEVGIITINANTAAFMTSGGSVSGSKTNIGRFIPDHFDISPPAIPFQCGTFTYGGYFDGINAGLDRNGQPFAVTGNITARNSANITTRNYATSTGFGKLINTDLTLQEYNVTATANDTGRVNLTPLAFSFVDGVSAYSDLNSDYQFDTLKAPFDLRLDLTVTDSDTVAGVVSSNAFEVRLGRMILQDSYGPEISDLEMRLKTEYFDGTLWTLNAQDSCSTYQDTQVSIGAYSGTGGTAVQPTAGAPTLSSGMSSLGNGIWFDAPGDGNYGSALINFDLSTQGWLRFDWNADNSIENATTGTLNFGYYRGSDRVIYWQEK